MTRITTLPPEWLTDRHLNAERFEMMRVWTNVRKAIEKGKTPKDFNIPAEFTFGRGHVTFFYNKLGWLGNRFLDLTLELDARNFNVTQRDFLTDKIEDIPCAWFTQYDVTPASIELCKERIAERIAAKPNLYPDAEKRMALWR